MATSTAPLLDKRAQAEGFKKHFGNRVEVFTGSAKCVKRIIKSGKNKGKVSKSSCVQKSQLTKNKRGEIVLASRSKQGKKNFSNLVKAGYQVRPGVFGVFKDGKNITAAKLSKKSKKSKKAAKGPFFQW